MLFAHPDWLWLLIAAPLAGLLTLLCWRKRWRDTAAWAARTLWNRLMPSHDPRRPVVLGLLLVRGVAAIVLALAQPRWGESEQQVERQGVDIVFVLDTSLSMATRDVLPNRLWVAQTFVRRLVQGLPGHRVALVQAEGDGVVMAPLTSDSAVIDLLLDAVQPGSLPTPGTELASAIERALELFPEGDGRHRVLVLLSDGEDHGSNLVDRLSDPLHDRGVVLHAVGVGTREGKPLELPDLGAADNGRRGFAQGPEYKRDEEGNVVVSRLVEESLEGLSRATGGLYLRADGVATDPAPLLERIDAMEKRSYGSEVVNTLEERFQWPLAVAIIALALQLMIAPFDPRTEDDR